jgi:signal transduction histidine kinase
MHELLEKLRPYAPGLSVQLALTTGLLVAIAVAAMYTFGVGSLRNLAATEGIARVELGAAAAREGLRQFSEDLVTTARIVAEQPPLQRQLRDPREALRAYLGRSCESVSLSACALVRGSEVLATTANTVDWPRVVAAATEQGERFLVTGVTEGTAAAGATADVAEHPGVRVLALRFLDAAVGVRLAERAGAAVSILDYESFQPGEGPLAVLNTDALVRGQLVSSYDAELDSYVAALPIATATGETIALLQLELRATGIMDPLEGIETRMLWVAVIIAALASLGGIFVGRHWIGAVEGLTGAARRLAAGDLAASVPTSGGKELKILGTTMDEMRRNLVELTAELRRREAEAQAVLGGIVEGVYAVDEQRRIRFLNAQAERLLNVSAKDVAGKFCGDVLKPQRDANGIRPCEHDCPILEARRTGSGRAVERIQPLQKGGVRRVVIASAPAGEADGLQVQVLRDETELEAVRHTRDTVLANISHEFRTPLAAQLASIELLRDGLGTMPPESQRQLVLSLQRGTQRLTWLIDNLLESVRIESGQLSIRHQAVAIEEVVTAARELIEPLVEQRGQRLAVEIDEDVPVIRGDQQRLTQVVVNLLGNASKFGPVNSAIVVRAQASATGGVHLDVEDEGPGPADVTDTALFERFHRGDGERDPDEGGLGLGLFIVRSIVSRHGGSVGLERTPDDRTRARVTLPPEPPEPRA